MSAISIRPNLDQTADQRILPDREAWTSTSPGVHRLSVASRAARDPFQQLQHERTDVIHDPYIT